jgi:membrane protease YdiL (CAAX protease family)
MDLGLILLLAFVPSIAASIYYLSQAQLVQFSNLTILGNCFRELSFLTLFAVLYFRQGRKLRGLGLDFNWIDLPKGASLFAIAFACYWLSYSLHVFGHASLYSPRSAGMFAATSFWVLIPFLCLNPFFEEILVRGYLMTEIIELRSSKLAAVLLSVAIQTSYHLHYGVSDALCLGAGLAIFAVYYAKSRRLMPVIFAHWLWDLTTLIGAWHR